MLPSLLSHVLVEIGWKDAYVREPVPRAMTHATERLRQALTNIRTAILSTANDLSVVDTLWMHFPCPETMIDYIDSELEATEGVTKL